MNAPKLTQSEAGYITAWQAGGLATWPPPGRGIRCGTCRWFARPSVAIPEAGPHPGNVEVPNGCRIVAGAIDSQGCCSVWNVGGRAITLISQRPSLDPSVYAKLEELLRNV